MGPADTLIKLLPDPVGRTAKTSFRSTNALIAFLCSSFTMNVLSMSSKTDSNLHISALQRQPCLLKTNSTRVLVTWLITVTMIICPSSYKARPDNLIGPNYFRFFIISPQRSSARPNFQTSNVVGGAKFGWYSGYQYVPQCSNIRSRMASSQLTSI